jgi:hypothetical protein
MDAVMSVPIIADFQLTAGSLFEARSAKLLVRVAVLACSSVLLLAAIVLWSRRAMGAISTPLPASILLAIGFAVAMTALAARYVWKRTTATRVSTLGISGLLSVSTLAFAGAASLPGSAPIGLVGLWLVVVGEELWAWWPRRLVRPKSVETTSDQPPQLVPNTDGHERFERAVADASPGLDIS